MYKTCKIHITRKLYVKHSPPECVCIYQRFLSEPSLAPQCPVSSSPFPLLLAAVPVAAQAVSSPLCPALAVPVVPSGLTLAASVALRPCPAVPTGLPPATRRLCCAVSLLLSQLPTDCDLSHPPGNAYW